MSGAASGRPGDRRVVLPVALAVTAGAAGALSLVPGVLTGEPVMNGSARGTAVVVLVVAAALVPVARRAVTGATRWLVVQTGLAAYLVYNAVMFSFATPLNRAFPAYEALLGLALATLVVSALDLSRVEALVRPAPRWVASYVGVVVVINGLAWLRQVVPALVGEHPTDLLAGSGLPTNPVHVQDLGVWLPLMGWLAVGMGRGVPRFVAWAGGGLVLWVVEAAGIALDQWCAHRADPTSAWASATAVPLFAVAALVGVAPLLAVLRTLPDRLPDRLAGQSPPTRRPVSSSQRNRT